MALSPEMKVHVKDVLKASITSKFNNYNPETENMPFHYRLLGKDRMALFSFIHSLNTTFGTSIYEPVAREIATINFARAETQVVPHNYVSTGAQATIQTILDGITTAQRVPDKDRELAEIKAVCNVGELIRVKLRKVDVLFEDHDGNLFFFDIKTVKPNIGSFEDYKRMLLTWAAAEMVRTPDVSVQTLIAIPYNPYEPQPYNRWTMRGMFDLDNEVKVAEQFWDFLGGDGAYQDLLDCFETAGIELRSVIDDYFSHFKNQ